MRIEPEQNEITLGGVVADGVRTGYGELEGLVWATTNLTPQTYDLLIKNIAASCLHAISKLYR